MYDMLSASIKNDDRKEWEETERKINLTSRKLPMIQFDPIDSFTVN